MIFWGDFTMDSHILVFCVQVLCLYCGGAIVIGACAVLRELGD